MARPDLIDKVAHLRTKFIEAYLEQLDIMDGSLESPIERAFFWAFCCQQGSVTGYGWMPPVGLPGADESAGACGASVSSASGIEMDLWSQVPVVANHNAYRLDFVLAARWERLRVFVDVELDGHDFHERTKEQAERDKKRDRDLQSVGYHVARFTGSQVYRDPLGVAEEAIGFALGLVRIRALEREE
jgi:hypothetical protein